MSRTVPYKCLRCESEGSYNGSLRHKDIDPVPVCRHHGNPVEMTPVIKEKR